MHGDVDAFVLTAANQCHRTSLTLETLLGLLRHADAPGVWMPHIAQFYSDVPVNAMRRFSEAHGIPPSTLCRYYEAYIRSMGDRNPDFERWVYGGDVGAPL